MIRISEVTSKKDLRSFVTFPFKLYKDSEYWVPPIISQELTTFDTTKNPVFKDAKAWLFLAYRDKDIVGRVAAIINWLEVDGQNIRKMRFGWMDFIDDITVSEALLEKVFEIGKEHDLDFVEGPIGFSNLDKVGVMTEGFNHVGSMITWYNHPYYADHFRKLGFEVEKEYLESKFLFSDINPDTFRKAQALIKRRYGLKALSFRTKQELLDRADEMFEVFERSHQGLASFVNINAEQRQYFKKKFIPFLNLEYVRFITDKEDKIIAFAIVTPSYASALQKMNGKLFPFGFRHLLKAKKKHEAVMFYLIGVLPEYQNKGVTAIIFDEFYTEIQKTNVVECIRGPELADNTAIHQIWKHFNPKVFKKRCTFRKSIP